MLALDISQLTKTYDHGLTALKGIDLTVNDGEFFALLGANGAGKSTALGIISSLVRKTSGTVSVFGHDIDTDTAKAKASLGIVPQEYNINFFEKVYQILVYQAGYYGVPRKIALERAEKYLAAFNLLDKWDTTGRELSGGMKRRLMIARALMHEPRLLLLDEPTAGVDIEIRRLIWDFLIELNRSGTTIILTTHYLEEAENLCNQIAIIDHGKVIENTSMKKLINKLNVETFILNTREPISTVSGLEEYNARIMDENTIEINREWSS